MCYEYNYFLFSYSMANSVLNLEKNFLWFLWLYKSNLINSGLDLHARAVRLNWSQLPSEILLQSPTESRFAGVHILLWAKDGVSFLLLDAYKALFSVMSTSAQCAWYTSISQLRQWVRVSKWRLWTFSWTDLKMRLHLVEKSRFIIYLRVLYLWWMRALDMFLRLGYGTKIR